MGESHAGTSGGHLRSRGRPHAVGACTREWIMEMVRGGWIRERSRK